MVGLIFAEPMRFQTSSSGPFVQGSFILNIPYAHVTPPVSCRLVGVGSRDEFSTIILSVFWFDRKWVLQPSLSSSLRCCGAWLALYSPSLCPRALIEEFSSWCSYWQPQRAGSSGCAVTWLRWILLLDQSCQTGLFCSSQKHGVVLFLHKGAQAYNILKFYLMEGKRSKAV